MELNTLFILGILQAIASCSWGEMMKRCNLFDGSGCDVVGSVFNFTYTGLNPRTDSECRRSYQLVVTLPQGVPSFECKLHMDVPEKNKYLYSFSASESATDSSPETPYIYGMGVDAFVKPKSVPYPVNLQDNYLKLRNVHSHPDNNRYSYISFRFHNGRVTMRSSSGKLMRLGHENLFNSTVNPVYIGLNRIYANTVNNGTGLCRVDCYSTYSLFSPGSLETEDAYPNYEDHHSYI